MSKKTCSKKCPFLLCEYGCCARPDLNGRAQRLIQRGPGLFERACSAVVSENQKEKEKGSEDEKNVRCGKCKYLNMDMGICIHPSLNGRAVRLNRSGDSFVKRCNLPSPSKNNKYNAKRVNIDGVWYDSIKEYDRFCELMQLEKAGLISDLKYHVRFPLIEKSQNGREIAYEADFVYFQNGQKVVEDVKSAPTKTRLYYLKKRLMLEKYGIKISEFE